MIQMMIPKNYVGVSLVELLVSLSLGLFVLSGLLKIYTFSNESYIASKNQISLQETIRAGYSVLQNDIYRARHVFGLNKDKELGVVLGGTDSMYNLGATECPDNAGKYMLSISQTLYGINDSSGTYGCLINNNYLRGDVLVLRYALEEIINAYDDNGLYIRAYFNEGKLFFGKNESDAANQLANQSGTGKLYSYVYYVGDSKRKCGNESIPSLFRITYHEENAEPVSQEVLPGIENLQFMYLESGQYKSADTVVDWNEVKAIKVDLLARSLCPESIKVLQTEYEMGDVKYNISNNQLRRVHLSQIVALRN